MLASEPTLSPVCHARSVIEIEAAAVTALLERLDDNFEQACNLILHCAGRAIDLCYNWLQKRKLLACKVKSDEVLAHIADILRLDVHKTGLYA